MFGKQLLLIDTFGQFAFVPEHDTVIVHFHLCMYSHIVTVYNGVANCFTHSAWCHHNLYVFLFALCKQVYIFHDAKVVDNLIRNVFHKFLGIRQIYHLLFIVIINKLI